MNEMIFYSPLSNMNMFRELEALMDFDFSQVSKGLKKYVKRPHNLITKKDKDGRIEEYRLEIVYTPFKKSEVNVQVLDNILTVKCGSQNQPQNENIDYCGISRQSYEFSIPLSDSIDLKNIKANAEDGMLYIQLPVKKIKEQKKVPMNIEIA